MAAASETETVGNQGRQQGPVTLQDVADSISNLLTEASLHDNVGIERSNPHQVAFATIKPVEVATSQDNLEEVFFELFRFNLSNNQTYN
jgi:hypothetical protein